MENALNITVLGSGTSQGVPVIACNCMVCTSNNPKDKRLRCSILISYKGENYVIDSGPDFRYQMLRENVQTLRAVLFTHEHKDHVSGLDDVRAFNFKENRDMQVYCSKRVEIALKREFHYVFDEDKYPGVPLIHLNTIQNEQFTLPGGLEVQPIEVMHYKMPVMAYRIKDFAYITDAKTISESEREKLKGVKVLIVNALRPEKAYLTHISHLFGTHEEIQTLCPPNVYPAFDGLKIAL